MCASLPSSQGPTPSASRARKPLSQKPFWRLRIRLPFPCHCEPVRTLARQSVSLVAHEQSPDSLQTANPQMLPSADSPLFLFVSYCLRSRTQGTYSSASTPRYPSIPPGLPAPRAALR